MVTINEMGEFVMHDDHACLAYVDDPRSLEYSKSNRARRHPCKAVVRSDGRRYRSAIDAAAEMAEQRGITRDTAESSIRRVLSANGGKASAYGYGWEYE